MSHPNTSHASGAFFGSTPAQGGIVVAVDLAADPKTVAPRHEIDAVAISQKAGPISYNELYGRRAKAKPRFEVEEDHPPARASVSGLRICVLVMALGMALVAGRNHMVRAAPLTARIYAAMGLPVNLRGLDLRNVRAMVLDDNGRKVLGIEGEIVNLTHQKIAVPDLAFALRQANGRELYTWTNPPQVSRIDEDGTVLFRARLAAPPEEAQNLSVHFVKQAAVKASSAPARAAAVIRGTE